MTIHIPKPVVFLVTVLAALVAALAAHEEGPPPYRYPAELDRM